LSNPVINNLSYNSRHYVISASSYNRKLSATHRLVPFTSQITYLRLVLTCELFRVTRWAQSLEACWIQELHLDGYVTKQKFNS